jgi:hypothetical protein
MQSEEIQRTKSIYTPVNCCSQGASISQLLAIGLFIGIEILGFNLIASMLAQ